ncbi:MAG: hypothetical protein QN178_05720 [Armatimonadota bacterium]|nr:hypothetical protein [Armatimonadota bacterium]
MEPSLLSRGPNPDLLGRHLVLADPTPNRQDLHPGPDLAQRHRGALRADQVCCQGINDEREHIAAGEDVDGPQRHMHADDAPRHDGSVVCLAAARAEGQHRQEHQEDDAYHALAHGRDLPRNFLLFSFLRTGGGHVKVPAPTDAATVKPTPLTETRILVHFSW